MLCTFAESPPANTWIQAGSKTAAQSIFSLVALKWARSRGIVQAEPELCTHHLCPHCSRCCGAPTVIPPRLLPSSPKGAGGWVGTAGGYQWHGTAPSRGWPLTLAWAAFSWPTVWAFPSVLSVCPCMPVPLSIHSPLVCVSHSVVSDSVISWTIAHQASLSVEFSRQEYWSGLPFPSPGDLPDPGIEPRSPALQADF